MTNFFRPDDFKIGAGPEPESIEIREFCAKTANKLLEEGFGNEYQIVMFWKEQMTIERQHAERLEKMVSCARFTAAKLRESCNMATHIFFFKLIADQMTDLLNELDRLEKLQETITEKSGDNGNGPEPTK